MAHFSAKLNFKCVLDVYRFALEEEEYVEFSKLTQDRIIGTKGEMATVSVIISIYEPYSVYQMVYIYTPHLTLRQTSGIRQHLIMVKD
jgi:hypothetical protein